MQPAIRSDFEMRARRREKCKVRKNDEKRKHRKGERPSRRRWQPNLRNLAWLNPSMGCQ
jgi:hypothetical protein